MTRWRESDPLVVDILLALLCAVVTFTTLALTDSLEEPRLTAAGVLFLLGQSGAVALRRTYPVLAWALAGGFAAAYGMGEYPDTVLDVGPLLVIFTVASICSRRTATVLGLITATTILVALAASGDANAEDYSFNLLVYAVAWIAGENQRTRRAYTAELEAKAARLERERDEEARRAVAEERARIAAELHDVVAHSVSMMVVQAEGGASVVQRSPEQAARAFDAIGSTGRDAMTEMRRVLGVLRSGDEARAVTPQPGLDGLDELVGRVREAGLAVEVVREGRPRPLAAGVDLSAYRIVQEALTNTLRHAEASSATVVVRYREDAVEVEVVDDGHGAASAPNGSGSMPERSGGSVPERSGGSVPERSGGSVPERSGGHGLVGMKERVALYGGELTAGPRQDGGFRVNALLPTGP